jgi:HEAT repeat protein
MSFDASAFIGCTVKEMETALKLYHAGKPYETPQPKKSAPKAEGSASDTLMEVALAELADETAQSDVRRAAALKIGTMRAEATEAHVARVVTEFRNPHDCEVGGSAISVRRAALLAFTELARGPDGAPAVVASCVPAVTALLGDSDEDVREMAVRAMGVLGSHADSLAVAARLEDEANDVRAAASDTLVVLRDTLSATVLGAIAAHLRNEDDDEIRAWALRCLAGIGAAAAAQSAAVVASLDDEGTHALTPPSRALAVTALAAFGGASAAAQLPRMATLLEDDEAVVRAAAVDAVGLVGTADDHGEAISELLCDPDRAVRSAANASLKRWGMA